VHKGLRIFVFLNEAILSFFTHSRMRLHFKSKFCSNFILKSLENQCRIYRRFQIRFLSENVIILSRDITHFSGSTTAKLLSGQEFLHVFQHSFDDISAISWSNFMQNYVLETTLVVDYMAEIFI
jgi:hypothetical protein